jgi:hypothetical protein
VLSVSLRNDIAAAVSSVLVRAREEAAELQAAARAEAEAVRKAAAKDAAAARRAAKAEAAAILDEANAKVAWPPPADMPGRGPRRVQVSRTDLATVLAELTALRRLAGRYALRADGARLGEPSPEVAAAVTRAARAAGVRAW